MAQKQENMTEVLWRTASVYTVLPLSRPPVEEEEAADTAPLATSMRAVSLWRSRPTGVWYAASVSCKNSSSILS